MEFLVDVFSAFWEREIIFGEGLICKWPVPYTGY